MNRFSFIYWFCCSYLVLLGACSGKKAVVTPNEPIKKEVTQQHLPNRDSLLANIKKQEEILFVSIDSFDANKAQTMRDAYLAYVDAFPKDHQDSPAYLLKAAEISRALKEYDRSNSLLERLVAGYPQDKQVPQALFLIGFTYENDLKNYEMAKKKYELFMELFPNHSLYDDVKFSVKYLGMTPSEILKAHQKEQQD